MSQDSKTTVTVDAPSAAAIERRVRDMADSYADDLFHAAGSYETDNIRCVAVRRCDN